MAGFEPSLRLLIEFEKYSQADVALMFGLSHQRIQQLCEKYGVATSGGRGLQAVRVWDDALNRFLPVGKAEFRRGLEIKRMAERQAARQQRFANRRNETAMRVRELGVELGRAPTLSEVATRIGLKHTPSTAGGMLQHYWGIQRGASFSDVTREVYAAAGFSVRGRGTYGHVRKFDARTHCKHGHSLSDAYLFVVKGTSRLGRKCRHCTSRQRRTPTQIAA
jgi:hypothetical protein